MKPVTAIGRGYRAATHWAAVDNLSAFGAIPTKPRVCTDRNRVTGGGVSSGMISR